MECQYFSDIGVAASRLGPPNLPIECTDPSDALYFSRKSCYRVALLVPLCGSAGLWSPSCIASAQVAVEELNRLEGIDGRQVQLLMIDAAVEAPTPVEEIINDLIETEAIDAIVGMHISAIRQRLSKIVKHRIPYIYTPLYEGGETTPGIVTIGETPDLQLGPAMDYLNSEYAPRKWALIGNDYVWPRASHAFAKNKIRELGSSMVYERYVPFGLSDMNVFVDEIKQSDADAVLLSLVGQDAVIFNRAFGEAELHHQAIRLSCAIEENGLLASGADSMKRLFSSSSYFGALQTDANAAFREKYYSMHGEMAPILNTLGQSTYEGLHCLAAMIGQHSNEWPNLPRETTYHIEYNSARREKRGSGQAGQRLPIYVARADGLCFEILKKL